METLITSIVLLTTLLAGIMTYVDISKRSYIPKRTRLNLYFAIFYLPLIGPMIYYSILRKKYISEGRRRP
jgi:hypothetical protein